MYDEPVPRRSSLALGLKWVQQLELVLSLTPTDFSGLRRWNSSGAVK
jgi:hypothetical protein